ncbi:MAG: hypothetical protein OEW04_11510 [Nitrospirota bacterium]|nr:hypothetical protein [Nitrospirota bacterium]
MWKIAEVMRRRNGTHRFRDAREKGCAHLLNMCRPDGGFGNPELGLEEYYKALSAFSVCGHTRTAARLCQWILSHGITPEGDFGPRTQSTGDFRYTYPNAWITIGAHRLGEFGLSQRGMEFLMGFRDPDSGGFFSDSTERDAETEQDVIYVSFCGLAALYTGRIGVARSVGGWLKMVMNCQPCFPEKFYTVYSRAKGLHITADSEIRYVVSRDAAGYQNFFQPGAAGAFLASLYQATGENEWLQLSREYMSFAENANAYLFGLLAAGKVGWAASLLYKITGEKKYREMAVRIGDSIIAAQTKRGYWNFPGTKAPHNGITAEMVVWLDAIHQASGE